MMSSILIIFFISIRIAKIYVSVTVNVHFLFRSDEKLTVNENNIIFDKIS